jgi:beta-glucanase (GH16 family)
MIADTTQRKMKLATILLCCTFLAYGCGSDEGTDPNITFRAPSLSVEDVTVNEGDADNEVSVTVKLDYDGTLSAPIVATVSSSNGTAVAGSDYVAVTDQFVTFSATTSKTQTVKILIKGDNDEESDETFTLTIVDAGDTKIDKSSAIITIKNEDGNGGSIVFPDGYTTPETYAGMTMIWSDEFSDSEVDASKWTFEIGNGSGGWGNQELQYYRKENTEIVDGHLVITALKEDFSNFDYTSTRMITKGKFDFKYGRVDIRANLPFGQGLWPALWMLGANISSVGWPSCGEIDIMEMVGSDNSEVHGTIHFANNNGDHAFTGGETSVAPDRLADHFHVYSIIWTETSIKWYIDDVEYHSETLTPSDRSELKNNHFLIFNIAVGGLWPGSPDATTIFPQRMIVDYVRVFQ